MINNVVAFYSFFSTVSEMDNNVLLQKKNKDYIIVWYLYCFQNVIAALRETSYLAAPHKDILTSSQSRRKIA